MPLINLSCLNGHQTEQYLHHWDNFGCETRWCDDCGELMAPVFSPGTSNTYFGEGACARVIYNLGHEPVTITSHQQHKDAMKKAGVVQGQPNFRRGMPGYDAF